jgi:AcrR family transcriptional regulator
MLAMLFFSLMATSTAPLSRIAERKQRDKEARRAQIIAAARRIAEAEGWPSVTVRRLSDEISYSQPVLYSHFESREAILAAVAIEGFQEIGLALQQARQGTAQKDSVEAVAAEYLKFAASSPALYEAMFSLNLNVPFDDPATPAQLRFAFSQLMELFREQPEPEVRSELFWASLHGIAELTRTRRFPPIRQRDRLRVLVGLFASPKRQQPPAPAPEATKARSRPRR